MAKKIKKNKHKSGRLEKTKKTQGPQGQYFHKNTLQQAMALHRSGHLQEAEVLYRQILQAEPEHFDALHLLGLLAHQVGKNEIGVELIGKALTFKPDCAEAHNNLGLILIDQGKLNEAFASFRKALSLQPDFAMAHYNLGNVLQDQGKLGEAISSYRQAVNLKPDFADAYYNLGLIFNNQGKLDEAIANYRQVLILQPDFAEAHNNLGVIFSKLGNMSDAIACYRKALSLRPNSAGIYKNLSTIIKYSEVDRDIQAMENLYNKKGDIPEADRIDLGFALGKAFEDLKDYSKAFDFILEANRLKRESYEYSIQEDQDLFARIKQIFSPDFFAAHHDTGSQDRTPIFILGMPRSGTTLVEQILASHPLVFGAGELAILENVINSICTGRAIAQFPECMPALGMETLERMGSDYISKVREHSSATEHITDKMPDNFLRVGLIETILPAAKVIHCMRHPMDNCLSIFKNDFSKKGSNKYAYNMVELGRYYNLYQDLMAYWEKVLPGFMYTIRYEEIVSDLQNQTKELLDFCGLPWDKTCLAFYKTERRVSTASLAQVRQPIYKDSIELWKRYERQLEPLRKEIYE